MFRLIVSDRPDVRICEFVLCMADNRGCVIDFGTEAAEADSARQLAKAGICPTWEQGGLMALDWECVPGNPEEERIILVWEACNG